MTATKTTVLRTGFNDTYVSGKLEFTQAGTEVPTSKVEEIVAEAARHGVRLHEVPADEVKGTNQTEGGSA
jgi:hypothetical protein